MNSHLQYLITAMLTGAAQVTVLMLLKNKPRISKPFNTPEQSGVPKYDCVCVSAGEETLAACVWDFFAR